MDEHGHLGMHDEDPLGETEVSLDALAEEELAEDETLDDEEAPKDDEPEEFDSY